MLGETLPQAEPDALELFNSIEGAKYLAVISCTILLYDIFLTLPEEVHYVWGSRWSFARFAFHANRFWGPILLATYVPTLFIYGLSEQMFVHRCVVISAFYTYGAVFAVMIVAIVLAVRIWAIYGRKPWILIVILLGWLAFSVPMLVLLQSSRFVLNPVPTIISGCTLKTDPLWAEAYIGPFIYETGIFAMTVYKIRKIIRTPLVQRLMRDGSKYYFIVIGTLILIGIGSFNPRTRHAVNGSGLFMAILSSMCSRLILSGLSFYGDDGAAEEDIEMHTLPERQSVESGIPGSNWIE